MRDLLLESSGLLSVIKGFLGGSERVCSAFCAVGEPVGATCSLNVRCVTRRERTRTNNERGVVKSVQRNCKKAALVARAGLITRAAAIDGGGERRTAAIKRSICILGGSWLA